LFISFADVTPEDYVIEKLAQRLLQDNQRRPSHSRGTLPVLRSDPGFTYRLSGRSSVSDDASPFAVGPSDPRYYEDTQSLTGQCFAALELSPGSFRSYF